MKREITCKKLIIIVGFLLSFSSSIMAQSGAELALRNSLMNGSVNEQCTGNGNSAFGDGSLIKNTTGFHNLAVGTQALLENTSGNNNTASGHQALFLNTEGHHNTATGAEALHSNTTGSNNSAVGHIALYDNISGSQNVAFGDEALSHNIASNNTAFGYQALKKNTQGVNNTALGYQADIYEETITNATAIGAGAIVKSSNTIQLGNSTVTNVIVGSGSNATFFAGKCVLGDVTTPVNTPEGYNLYVKEGILAEKVKVALSTTEDWSDYVFAKNYALQPLQEVEAFVKMNKHLPGVASAEELVKEGGIDVNKMFAKQMEKIEELTLYLIDMKKEIENLKKENASLKFSVFAKNQK